MPADDSLWSRPRSSKQSTTSCPTSTATFSKTSKSFSARYFCSPNALSSMSSAALQAGKGAYKGLLGRHSQLRRQPNVHRTVAVRSHLHPVRQQKPPNRKVQHSAFGIPQQVLQEYWIRHPGNLKTLSSSFFRQFQAQEFGNGECKIYSGAKVRIPESVTGTQVRKQDLTLNLFHKQRETTIFSSFGNPVFVRQV